MFEIVIELAASTLFCLDKPWNEALTNLLEIGTGCIELTDEGLHALTQRRVDSLLELKESYGLRYSLNAPFADVNIAANDSSLREAILRRLERSIQWACDLEVEALVFHPGASSALERFSPSTAWRFNLESVRRLFLYSREKGVRAMIENVPEPFPFLLKSVDDFKRFYGEVGVEIEMVFDVAHAHLRGEIREFMMCLGEKICHVHVSDNNGGSDEHLPLGGGSINWMETMAAVKAMNLDGWVVVESLKGVEESLGILRNLLDCV